MVRSLSRSRSNSGVMKSALSRSTPIKKTTEPESPKSFGERWSSALLGVKGSSLTRNYEFEENPMARLKLLLVRRLHIDYNHLLTELCLLCSVSFRLHHSLHCTFSTSAQRLHLRQHSHGITSTVYAPA